MKENTPKAKAVLHGEAIIFEASIPASARPVPAPTTGYRIIAPSEVTGNHHVIDCPRGVEFLEDDGKFWMKSSVPTQVRCLLPSRHDSITLPPGEYGFGIQQEYDYIAEAKRNVAD
jgi:hypothetical protein